jgi:hypothetical protein
MADLKLQNRRGDKTAIELFLAGLQGWEDGLRQIVIREPDGDHVKPKWLAGEERRQS